MSHFFSIRPVYCLFVTGLFVLSGCQTQQAMMGGLDSSSSKTESAEDLLDADGQMAWVDEKRAPTPIEQHMLARKNVDPVHIDKKNKFTTNVNDSHAKDDNNFRVIRVEGDSEALSDDGEADVGVMAHSKGLKIVPNPVEMQNQNKSYVEDILAKHKARQEMIEKNNGSSDIAVSSSDLSDSERDTLSAQALMKADVQNVRIGQHPGKTRVVFDVSHKANFSTRFEDGDKILVVTLPNASWSAAPNMKVADENLVLGYDAFQTFSGSEVKIRLSAPGRLMYQSALAPADGHTDRIVLDVSAR